MSDFDDREETDRSEDEEEEERFGDLGHKRRIVEAKKWIRNVVEKREEELAEGATKKVRLTDEDVSRFFERFSDLSQRDNEKTPTLLLAIVDLIHSDEGVSIDSVTVKALVQKLVEQSTHLLCITNDEQQNPLYLAIAKKKRVLADYMVVSCPEEENARQYLAKAIEDSRGNEKRKNCLHLAFEKDMKPTTLLRMLKDARNTALEAVDATGRRPMHYAVQYKHCNIEVIRAFIDRDKRLVDNEKKSRPRQPTNTFLDVSKEAKISVYQELVSSALVHNEERNSKKESSEDKKKKEASLATGDNSAKQVREQRAEATKGRTAAAQTKSEPKLEPKPDNAYAIGHNQAGPAGFRDPRDAQDQSGKPGFRPSRLREMERQSDIPTNQERGESSAYRNMSNSRDRQSLGRTGSPDSLRIQTTFTSTTMTKPTNHIAANTPRLLKRAPTMDFGIAGDDSDKRVKQTAMVTKKSKKLVDHEAMARVSTAALRILKLHYMRTRTIQKATEWLYGTNPQDVQTFFHLPKLPNVLKEDILIKGFEETKFDEVLSFVHFPNVTVIRRKLANSKSPLPDEVCGRRDMEVFFKFLHGKGVRHILKVSVEENGKSLHADEAIKNALDHITVEHLDWQKPDLNPQVICGISSQADETLDKHDIEVKSRNKIRRLDLRWSGNTAVLRAWSEREGLPSLKYLESVKIIIPDDTVLYDSPKWIMDRIAEFEERLNKQRVAADSQQEANHSSSTQSERKITVKLVGLKTASDKKTGGRALQSGLKARTSGTVSEKIINTHEWLKWMDAFAQKIDPLWTSVRASFLPNKNAAGGNHEAFYRPASSRLESEVVVALIDDGVALLDQNLVGRVLEGKTFDYSENGVGQSYNSARGHGTEMARCILRACPMAKIYPIRLKTLVTADEKSQIDLQSAALAIRAALERDATIISMSWTIPIPKDPSPAQKQFEEAVREACKRNVLMFCSSPDGGQFNIVDYPSAVQRDKIFRIGAAHDHGSASESTDKDVDFILPGVKVNINDTSPTTGSSVATALAAGLAATIIYCFKICALWVKKQSQTTNFNQISPSFTSAAIGKLREHETMKTAFCHLGWVNTDGFIQIWDQLMETVQEMDDSKNTDEYRKVQCIMDLCNQLMPVPFRSDRHTA